jgi:hypothetical protein
MLFLVLETLAPTAFPVLTRVLGLDSDQVRALLNEVTAELRKQQYRVYLKIYYTFGQKPALRSQFEQVVSSIESFLEAPTLDEHGSEMVFCLDDVLLRLRLWEEDLRDDEDFGRDHDPLEALEAEQYATGKRATTALGILSRRVDAMRKYQEQSHQQKYVNACRL